ncbi:lactoylglutathione lyase [Peptoniphilus olsenii]|uniref:Aldoketomutase n=1 Tax=Peptoniphilus olsenii TaxID=411570 RepID=A0ABV2JCQ4_9FIRM
MKFLHTCVRVKNLEKSERFYKEMLGFIESSRKDFPKDKFTLLYLKLPNSDYELELTYNYDRQKPYELGDGYGHIAISNEDIKSFREELLQKGCEVTELSGLSDGGANYFFVKDPDGYKIEIIQEK